MKRLAVITQIIISTFVITLSAQAGTPESIKGQVAIVRPDISEAHKTYAKEMEAVLNELEYPSAANTYKKYEKGWYGSGFAVKGKDGKSYLITNRNVTKGIDKVTVEFAGNGQPVIYKDCPVLSESKKMDLSIIGLPQGHPADMTLEISQEAMKDGREIWSAGYAEAGGKAEWKLSMGIVSKVQVNNAELGGAGIQHSANIGAGNAGGPLLILSKGKTPSFTVAGINTQQEDSTGSTAYSIPAKHITEFIDQVASKKSEGKEKEIEQVAQEFQGAILAGYEDVIPYISDEYLYSISSNNFQALFTDASSAARIDVKGYLNDDEGDKAARTLIADHFNKSIQDGKETLTLQSTEKSADGTEATTVFNIHKEQMKFNWKTEDGEWKITSSSLADFSSKISTVKTKRKVRYVAQEDIAFNEQGIQFSFQQGVRSLEDISLYNIEVGYHRYTSNILMIGLFLNGGKEREAWVEERLVYDEEPWDYHYEYDYYSQDVTKITATLDVGIIVPIGIGKKFVITPYYFFGFGMYLKPIRDFLIDNRGGIRLGWRYDDHHQIYVGANYMPKNVILVEDGGNYISKRRLLGINIGWDF